MSLLDQETLANFRELQGDDQSFIPNYFRAFLEGVNHHLAGLKIAAISKNAHALSLSAHAIKSSCANTGVTRVMELCATLETMGKQGETVGAPDLIAVVEVLLGELQEEIHDLPEMKPRGNKL